MALMRKIAARDAKNRFGYLLDAVQERTGARDQEWQSGRCDDVDATL